MCTSLRRIVSVGPLYEVDEDIIAPSILLLFSVPLLYCLLVDHHFASQSPSYRTSGLSWRNAIEGTDVYMHHGHEQLLRGVQSRDRVAQSGANRRTMI